MRFVFRIELVAEGLPAGIEDDGDVFLDAVVAQLVEQLDHHGRESAYRAHVGAVGARQLRQGVERPEDVARPIDQVEALGANVRCGQEAQWPLA